MLENALDHAKMALILPLLLAVGARQGPSEKPEDSPIFELSSSQLSPIEPDIIAQQAAKLLEDKERYPYKTLARIYLIKGDAHIRLKQPALAKADYESALQLVPSDPEITARLARSYLYLRQLQGARELASKLVKHNPNLPDGHCLLAGISLITQDYPACVGQASEALKLDSKCSDALLFRAEALYQTGKRREALTDIDQYIQLSPLGGFYGPANSYVIRGKVLLHLGRTDAALESYLMAKKLSPTSFEAAFGIWMCYDELGKRQLSVMISEQLVREHPRSIDAVDAGVLSYVKVGCYEDASKLARTGLELEPTNAQVHFRVGNIHQAQQMYGQAIASYNKALALDRQHQGALASKAFVLAACPEKKFRNGPEALKLATTACELTGSKNATYVFVKGAAHAECGQFEEAVTCVEKALKIGAGDRTLEDECRICLRLYNDKKPYRK
jgi:tetratricopeptide (TPR) repeat protein